MNRQEYLANPRPHAKRGTTLPHAKLDEKTIKDIRAQSDKKRRLIDRLNAKYSAKALARKYRVHYRTIEKILSYETWVHVR